MKRLLLSTFLFVVLHTALWAIPASCTWQEGRTADGKTILVRHMGDEFFSYWEDEDGQVVEQDANGYWRVVGSAASISRRMAARKSPLENRPHKDIGPVNLAPRGLVIMVNYSDVAFSPENDIDAMREMLNGDNYTYDGATGSARKYFIDQSDGQYQPQFDVVGPVTLDKPRAYYGATSGNATDVRPAQMAVDACLKADALGVDFSQYDSDNDGLVDFVFILFADKGEADGGPAEAIWPHNWYVKSSAHLTCKVDGKYIDNYACAAEKNGKTGGRTGIGTFCHEFSHVIGMPDYYDTKNGTNYSNRLTPKTWSIMDNGSYNNDSKTPPNYSIFDKYFMGWKTPEVLGSEEVQTVLVENGQPGFVGYQISSSESLLPARTAGVVYYAESRERTGWDIKLPSHGLVVWKVNFNQSAWTSNTPNNTAYQPRYTLVSASGSTTGLGTGKDAFPGQLVVHELSLMEGREFSYIDEVNKVVSIHYNRSQEIVNISADTLAVVDKTKQTDNPYLQLSGACVDEKGQTCFAQLHIRTNQYAKTYTAGDIDLTDTYLTQGGERINFTGVTAKVLVKSGNTYHIEATMVEDKYTSYVLSADFHVYVPAPKQYTLTIADHLHGSVALNAANYVTQTNTGTYVEGTEVKLIPTPAAGCRFTSWSGTDMASVKTQNGVYTITISGKNYSLVAGFEQIPYTLTVTSSSSDLGSVALTKDEQTIPSGSQLYYGDEVELIAIPAENCYFNQWSDGNKSNPRHLTIKNTTSLTAQFLEIVKPTAVLKAFPARDEEGSVTILANGQPITSGDTVEVGTEITLTATENTYYHFTQWSDGNKQNPRVLTLYTNATYEAQYEEELIPVVLGPTEHGSVLLTAEGYAPSTSQGQYKRGTQLTLLPHPETGYQFAEWIGADSSDIQTSAGKYILTVSHRDYDLSARFTKQQWSLSAEATHGTVLMQVEGTEYPGGSKIDYGTEVLLTAIPSAHYHFTQWSDGNTLNPRTVLVKGDATYTAQMEEDAADTLEIHTQERLTLVDSTASLSLPYMLLSGTAKDEQDIIYHLQWLIHSTQYIGTYTLQDMDPAQTFLKKAGVEIPCEAMSVCVLQKEQGIYYLEAHLQADKYTIYHLESEFEVIIPEPEQYLVEVKPSSLGVVILRAKDYVQHIDSGRYVEGTTVELVPQPATGYQFKAWTGPDAGQVVATPGQYTLYIDARAYALEAEYEKTMHRIIALPKDTNEGKVTILQGVDTLSSGAQLEYGTSLTLSATAYPHYHFSSWTDGVVDSIRAITLLSDACYTAEFARNPVHVQVSDGGLGTVSLVVEGQSVQTSEGVYAVGTVLSLIPTPKEGYRFVRWQGTNASEIKKVGSEYLLTIVDYTYQLEAVFERIGYTVTATSKDLTMGSVLLRLNGDSIHSGSTVLHGEEVEMSALPVPYYRFVDWSDGCTESTRSVVVKSNITLQARFEEVLKHVAITTGEGGEVSLSASGYAKTINEGDYRKNVVVTLVPTAKTGYRFVGWAGEDAKEITKSGSSYRLTILQHDYDIEAVFVKRKYVVKAVSAQIEKGSVLMTADGSVVNSGDSLEYGTDLRLMANAEYEHHFVTWSDGNTQNPRQWIVSANINLKASFAHDTLPIIHLYDNEIASYYDSLSARDGVPVDIVVLHRTIKANTWSTIALPFDIDDVSKTELSGCIYKYVSGSGNADVGISLYVTATNTMKANVPYIMILNRPLVDPYFTNVVLRQLEDKSVHGGDLDFCSYMRPTHITGAGKSIMGFSNNKIYYPNVEKGIDMKAFRAVFKILSQTNDVAPRVHIVADGQVVNTFVNPDGEEVISDSSVSKQLINGVLYIRHGDDTQDALGRKVVQ